MLSNAYFLATFRFDTAENEAAKNLQKRMLILLIEAAGHGPLGPPRGGRGPRARGARGGERAADRGAGPRAGAMAAALASEDIAGLIAAKSAAAS